MKRPLCKLCGKLPATVPDRDKPGRFVRAICSECHARRLADDLMQVAKQRPKTP